MALARNDRRDREQRPGGCGALRELGRVHAGLRNVDTVARQRVELEEGSSGPGAGRDDGRGGREHRSLPLADAFIRRPLTQGHVHEHDQPQAAGLRDEHLGGRRSDQPVDEDEAAITDPGEGIGERGVGRCIGPGPRSPDLVLVDRPAGGDQAPGHLSVVGVAPARPRRVIDPCRNDDVHGGGHNARS